MSVFDNSDNVKVKNSIISTVAGDQNVAQTMIINQIQDSRKRERKASGESDIGGTNLSNDNVNNHTDARSMSAGLPTKKIRIEEDRAVDWDSISHDIYNNIGQDNFDGSSARKRERRASGGSTNSSNDADFRHGSTRMPTKRIRMDKDRADDRQPNNVYHHIGGDSYTAKIQVFSRDSQADPTILSKLNAAKEAGRAGSKACLKGTRVSLLQRIQDWALDSS
ncbi:hypothetical protein H0H92_012634, partial [Tricholoma furcatifolium]